MRINLRHGATAVILAAAFSVLGSAAANAAAIPGAPAANPPHQGLLPPPNNRCHEWDWWKYDSCRHDSNHCTFRVSRVYRDKYGRYTEEGYYLCTQYPKPGPYGQR